MRKVLLTILASISFLSGCQFHLQGDKPLAPPLKKMYIKTPDPYGPLARNLTQSLKMSGVVLTQSPQEARTILTITKDTNTQVLVGVDSTQQTRQYNLIAAVEFDLTDAKGHVILSTQRLEEKRIITIQSSQILGTSNESTLFYQQMRRTLAYAIMNRLASQDVTQIVNKANV